MRFSLPCIRSRSSGSSLFSLFRPQASESKPRPPTLLWNISGDGKSRGGEPCYTFRVACKGQPSGPSEPDLNQTSIAVNAEITRMAEAFPALPPLRRAVSLRTESALRDQLREQGWSVPHREVFKPGPHSTEQTCQDFIHFQSHLPTDQALSNAEMKQLPTDQPSMPAKEDGRDTVYLYWWEPEATTQGTQDNCPELRVATTPHVLTAKERSSLIDQVRDEVKHQWQAKSCLSRLLLNGPAWREHKAREMAGHYLRGRGLTDATVETIRDPSFFPWTRLSEPDPTWTHFKATCQQTGQGFTKKSSAAHADWKQGLSAAFWDVVDTTIPDIVNKRIPELFDRLKTRTSAFWGKEEPACDEGSSV